MPYNAEERDRSPLNVILDQQCHASMADSWRRSFCGILPGFKPLVLDLTPASMTIMSSRCFRSKDAGAAWQIKFVRLATEPVFKTLGN